MATPLYDETFLSNEALAYIGSPPIPSWNGASVEAIQCEQLFPLARDMALALHDWGFASRDDMLALVAEPEAYTGWDYAYEYPAECLAFREIIDPATFHASYSRGSILHYDKFTPIKWDSKIMIDPGGDKRRIVTNQEEAEGRYTTRIETLVLWSIPALNALTCILASKLAIILKGDMARQKSMFEQALLYSGMAEGQDASEQFDQPDDSSALSKSRM